MILAQTEFHMRESYSSTLEGQMLRKISNRARRLIVIVKMMQDAANKLWKYPQPLGLDTDTRLDKCLYLSQDTKSFSDGIDLFVPANYVCDWGNRSSCVVVSPVMGESDRRAQGSLGKRDGEGEEKKNMRKVNAGKRISVWERKCQHSVTWRRLRQLRHKDRGSKQEEVTAHNMGAVVGFLTTLFPKSYIQETESFLASSKKSEKVIFIALPQYPVLAIWQYCVF